MAIEVLADLSLGELLHAARRRLGKTTPQIGRELGVSYMTVLRWEEGRMPKLASVFYLGRMVEQAGFAPPGHGIARLEEALRVTEHRRASTSAAGRERQEVRRVNLAFLPFVPDHIPRQDHRFHGRRIIQR